MSAPVQADPKIIEQLADLDVKRTEKAKRAGR